MRDPLAPTPLRPPPRKKDILQAVYEDNRPAADGAFVARRRSPPAAPPRGRWPWLALPLAVVVALVAGGVAWTVGRPAAGPDGLEAFAPLPEADLAPAPGTGRVAGAMGLRVRTIVLDAGHGGRDPGALGPHGLQEKAVTLDVARRLRDRLARYDGLDIVLTRDGDAGMGLKERVAFANAAGADLFLSVHVNALPDSTLAPVETYYFGAVADSSAQALAQAENAGSAFSVSEFNAVLRRAGTAVKLEESQALARSLQSALLDERTIHRGGAADWGAKPAPFAVLLHTEAPAVLAEITALSNPAEEALLRTAAYRDAIAAALEQGVLAYLGRSLPADARPRPDAARRPDRPRAGAER